MSEKMVRPKKKPTPQPAPAVAAPKPFAGGAYYDPIRRRHMILTDLGPVPAAIPPAVKIEV